ncbi:two-component sensor histidine kinase [Bradyrhizobium sp. I1.8.5]|uniref:sensor histidine kinase n=1 Tax=Bradyrhizobium sp. I1.8.5 TaxID=3156365 RepID=UPI0033966ED6
MEERSIEATESDVLDKLRRHIRILVDIGRLSMEDADIERFLDQAVLQIARAVEIHHVKVLQYRPDTSDLLLMAGVGWKKGVVRTATLSVDFRSPPGRAFQTAEPVSIRDFGEQEEFVRSELLAEHGIVAVSNVPVLIGGAAWGVLEVDSTKPRDFSQDTTEFLTAAAALIGAALRRDARPDEHARLMAAIAEAQKGQILLREMQHRVKNNFQLVLSSISIQKRRYPDPESHRALDHVASRINAISLAHDQLAPRQEGQIVRLSHYIRALCSAIRNQVEEIEVDVECDELELTIDRALPVGLILNETAMNSIKHAFGAKGGRIKVNLVGGVGFGEARLTVSDNGRGIQNPNENGSGLKLIASLARQIGGTVDQNSGDAGTTTTLTFPLIT